MNNFNKKEKTGIYTIIGGGGGLRNIITNKVIIDNETQEDIDGDLEAYLRQLKRKKSKGEYCVVAPKTL